MRGRLFDLFMIDRAARLRMYAVAWTVSSVCGVLVMLGGTTVQQAAIGSSLLSLAILLAWTFVYCAVPHRLALTSDTTSVGRRFVLASVLSAFSWAFSISGRRLEAAVLDRRLLRLTRNPILSSQEADEVADALDTARQDALTLSSATKIRVRDAVKTTALENPTPPFTDAASALVEYTRGVAPSPAEIAMDEAARKAFSAIRYGDQWPLFTLDRTAAESAISALTRAIDLSGSDTKLAIDALLSRGELYEVLSEHDKALGDIQAAEKLGAADLSDIITTEGLALVNRGIERSRVQDLKRAIELLTLKSYLPPPSVISGEPNSVLLDQIGVFANRARANYVLGQYTAAIQDSRRVIELLPRLAGTSGKYAQTGLRVAFLMIVASHLHMNNSTGALDAASELERADNGDPRDVRLRQILEDRPADPRPQVLNNIEAFLGFTPLEGR